MSHPFRSLTLPAAVLGLVALGACSQSRPAQETGGGAGSTASCTACHGDAQRAPTAQNPALPAAPPAATSGGAAAVEAHQAHLNDGPLRAAVACENCHVVPADFAHVSSGGPVVVFRPGYLATTQGASPSFDGTALTCSATWCHGGFQLGSVSGNGSASPAWSSTTALGCTGCHGMPPTGHPTLTGTITASTCGACHPATVRPDGTIDVAGGMHIDGQAQVQGGHADPAWADPTHHGYQANAAGLATCTGCHVGFGLAAGAVGSSCNDCHAAAVANWQTSCTFCHGAAGRGGNLAGTDPRLEAAPPVGSQGQLTPSQVAVGAHQAHVNPTSTGVLATPIGCTTCHPSPLPTDVAHVNGHPAPVQFGGLAVFAGAQPTYQRGESPTCSATYCHGNFRFGAVVGNAAPSPAWNSGVALDCTGCHGMPPVGHTPLTGVVTGAACSFCHYQTVLADGTIDLARGKHMDGQPQALQFHSDPLWANPTHHGYQANAGGLQVCAYCHVGLGGVGGAVGTSCNDCHAAVVPNWQTNCTFCHGTAGRAGNQPGTDRLLAAAPPVGSQGETAVAAAPVGAHEAHVNPPATGGRSQPFGCINCHPSPLPGDITHVKGRPTPVAFGGLAVAGGARPTYQRGATPTCSSTYCHGNFQFGRVTGNPDPSPAWNSGTPLGCNGCHGMPPLGHFALVGTVTAATCNACHAQTVKADGTIDVAGGKHLDGQPQFEGGHTDPLWADPTHHGYQASASGLQACTGCHVDFGSVGGAAGTSCNGCHSGGSTAWQTTCTFCHGVGGRAPNRPGTDPLLPAAPPVGSQGQTTSTQAAVGAHLTHVNPPSSGARAAPIACVTCHPSPLPAGIEHVNGQPTQVQFSGVAVVGGRTPSYARGATPTCSSTYCHAGMAGGTNPTPAWTGGPMSCVSCHASPPTTGQHGIHPGGTACGLCHPGFDATGTVMINPASHVNGTVDLRVGDGTWSCYSCH